MAPLRHQAGDERYVPRQPIQLRDQDATLRGLGAGEGGCELRPALERVGALTGLGLDELGDDRDAFGLGEPLNRRALGLDPEARALLLLCGDTVAGDSAIHTKSIPPFAVCMAALSEQ